VNHFNGLTLQDNKNKRHVLEAIIPMGLFLQLSS